MTATLEGQAVRLDPAIGEQVGLAVWFHGQGGTADNRMNEEWLNSLRREGWAVAAGDMQRVGWGNDASVADAERLVDWAEDQTGTPANLFVAGSMGGLTSLRLMSSGVVPRCWYGIMPVVDLSTVAAVPGAANEIKAAWPDGSPASLDLATLPSSATYRLLASPDDTWVPKSTNADAVMGALASVGASVSLREVHGAHGDDSHFDGTDLATFAAECR